MKHFRYTHLAAAAVLIFAWICRVPAVEGAFLYKSYVVKQDRGREILCDPYIVQRDDYVLKLLRQKGEIAAEDFPEFLAVFQRINSHIRDIDLIRPGQQIFIPLRELRSNEMPGQSTGIVTVPYVTITDDHEQVDAYAERYRVRKGDVVSRLIASRFGPYGSDEYWEGVRLFRMMNPKVIDLDRIFVGQMLALPEPSIRKAPWYAEVVGRSTAPPASVPPAAFPAMAPAGKSPAKTAADPPSDQSPLGIAADALQATLLDRGTYFFPRPRGRDFRLDLSRVPAMEFSDRSLVLMPESGSSDVDDLKRLDPFPERVHIVSIQPDWGAKRIVEAVMEETGRARPLDRLVISDGGMRVEIRARWITARTIDEAGEVGRICIIPLADCTARTPEAVVRYLEEQDVLLREVCEDPNLPVRHAARPSGPVAATIEAADRRSFVREVLGALGCQYAPNVSISFPYAGVQVRTQTNLVALPDGREFLIDFGDLYGDAVAAIERTGFSVVRIHQQDPQAILLTLLEALGRPFRRDPTLMAANREGPYNVAVTFSGFLVESGSDAAILLSAGDLHHRMVDFLHGLGIRVIQVGMLSGAAS